MDSNWEQTIPPAVLMQLGLQSVQPSLGLGTQLGAQQVGTPAGASPGGGNPVGSGAGLGVVPDVPVTPSGPVTPGGGGNEGQRINNANFVSSLFQTFRE